MTEERGEVRDLEAMREVVIAAAIRYRDAMRRYMAGQVAAMDRGASLDDLMSDNHEGFLEAAQAEEELFALLDTLDAMRAEMTDAARERNPST